MNRFYPLHRGTSAPLRKHSFLISDTKPYCCKVPLRLQSREASSNAEFDVNLVEETEFFLLIVSQFEESWTTEARTQAQGMLLSVPILCRSKKFQPKNYRIIKD